MIATLNRYAPWMLGIFRIVVALVYMEHGTQKLFHFPPPEARFGGPGARAASQAAKAAVDTAASTLSSVADGAASAVSSMLQTIAPSAAGPAAQGGPPSLGGLFLVAAILETFGGLAMVPGILTRPLSFIAVGECVYIYSIIDAATFGTF